jgi:catalase
MKGTLMLGAAALSLAAATAAFAQQDQVTPNDAVTALEQTYGVHQGQRRNHTKGMCATGNFVGLPEAASYSRSALFSGSMIPVVARFSLAGGNPAAADTEKSPRGLGLEFRLPDGSKQHMTMLNTPMFLGKVPATFVERIESLKPDPATGKPNPDALKAFAEAHPEAAGQANYLASHNPPPSYANSAFFGIHTFKFIDKNDKVTLVKWRFVPEEGEKSLNDAELKSMPPDFLQQALIDRVKQGPVKWDMWVTIGEPGDPETDPTALWPSGRKEVKAGTLTFTSATPQDGAECKNINYDPLVMSDGIAPTDDPVLLFRSPSYAISFIKRMQGK